MKILVVNDTPDELAEDMDILLQPFLKGARDAGAETETVYLRSVDNCLGCYVCWQKTFGICDKKDDIMELSKMVQQADAIVYAAPLSSYSVFNLMKICTDHNPESLGTEPMKKKVVLISNHYQSGPDAFRALTDARRLINGTPNRKLAGTILCRYDLKQSSDLLPEYIAACEKASRELVESGAISPTTQTVLLDDPRINNG